MSDDLIGRLEDEITADRSERSLRARIRVLTEQRDAAVARAEAAEALTVEEPTL